MFRLDPGPCPIYGAAHAACTADSGPVAIVQLPARDEMIRAGSVAPAEQSASTPVAGLVADQVQGGLSAGQFTTGTYRGRKK